MTTLSLIIPARDESATIGDIVRRACKCMPEAEIIVVDDGSTDTTAQIADSEGATVIRHGYCRGNGASVKSGARKAVGELLAFMDGDGQHAPEDIPRLSERLEADGHDLVIGARTRDSQASVFRALGNQLYNRLASWIVGHPVADLTSGMRVVRARRFREFLSLLPNGFSYPTTSTMAFYRAGYGVAYEPIEAGTRSGKSHLRVFHDGARFFLIIFRVATLYSPLKIFFPLALLFFLSGAGYVAYTILLLGRFTNFGGLLLTTSVIIFLIGLVSEQITQLLYAQKNT